MRGFIQEGDTLRLTAPSGGVTSGTPLMIGSLLVVPVTTQLEAESFEGVVKGVVEFTKTASQAWTEGQKIHWNTSTNRFDSSGAAGPLVGVASEAVAGGAGDVLGRVRLNAVASDSAEGQQPTIAAPSAITNYAAVVNMTDPVTKAQGEAVSAALATLENEVTALRVTVADILAALKVAGIIASA